jgi:hypothetical protein
MCVGLNRCEEWKYRIAELDVRLFALGTWMTAMNTPFCLCQSGALHVFQHPLS